MKIMLAFGVAASALSLFSQSGRRLRIYTEVYLRITYS